MLFSGQNTVASILLSYTRNFIHLYLTIIP